MDGDVVLPDILLAALVLQQFLLVGHLVPQLPSTTLSVSRSPGCKPMQRRSLYRRPGLPEHRPAQAGLRQQDRSETLGADALGFALL